MYSYYLSGDPNGYTMIARTWVSYIRWVKLKIRFTKKKSTLPRECAVFDGY
jgi:hypothetical protein